MMDNGILIVKKGQIHMSLSFLLHLINAYIFLRCPLPDAFELT